MDPLRFLTEQDWPQEVSVAPAHPRGLAAGRLRGKLGAAESRGASRATGGFRLQVKAVRAREATLTEAPRLGAAAGPDREKAAGTGSCFAVGLGLTGR